MGEDQRREELLGTTDCLEAVNVFKSWKNFLFVIAVICLILLQICFWLIDAEIIRPQEPNTVEQTSVSASSTASGIIMLAAKTEAEIPADVAAKAAAVAKDSVPTAESSEADAEPNRTAGKMELGKMIHIQFKHIAWLVRVCNYLLIFVAAMYCLTMLFCLKISLLGRLGGLNHISRAFLLSLLVFVLLLPWQKFFGGVSAGLIYTPKELLNAHAQIQDAKVINIALYYLRFSGLWVIVTALLVFSQIRSIRWSKATLRRLGVI